MVQGYTNARPESLFVPPISIPGSLYASRSRTRACIPDPTSASSIASQLMHIRNRISRQVFERIAALTSETVSYKVEVSYMEIYNEKVRHLQSNHASDGDVTNF